MPAVTRILPNYTIAEREKWEDKWELIEGIPFAMSPAPIPSHQRVSFLLAQEMHTQLRKNCKGCKVYQAIDWKVSEDTVFIPDLLITCKPVGKKNLETPPELVVEILSPSTAVKDRNTKFTWYQLQKVKYYLLVNTDSETVEIFELLGDAFAPVAHNGSFSFSFSTGCEIGVSFKEIWD